MNAHGIYRVPCGDCKSWGRVKSKEQRRNGSLVDPQEYRAQCSPCKGSGLIRSDAPARIDTGLPMAAIIGGGIGGMALAVACRHRGIPFRLYEKDESLDTRSAGYGLTLQQASNAMRAFGIKSLQGGVTSTKHIVYSTSGSIIAEWGMRRWGVEDKPELTKRRNEHVSRQALRKQLYDMVRENDIRWGYSLKSIELGKGDSILEFETKQGVVSERADLVVGSDGIRSKVRELVLPDNMQLEYSGCLVILGICTLDRLQNIESELLDSATVFQMVNGHERMYVMPYDADTIMWQFSYRCSEDHARTLASDGSDALRKDVLKRTGAWSSPVPEIVYQSDTDRISAYPIYDRGPLHSSSLRKIGSVTLIGDAAHPMSPFKGQGANQALLDALSLARRIYNMKDVKNLRNSVLDSFEREMIARSKPKVLGSRMMVDVLHSKAVLRTGDEPRGRGIV